MKFTEWLTGSKTKCRVCHNEFMTDDSEMVSFQTIIDLVDEKYKVYPDLSEVFLKIIFNGAELNDQERHTVIFASGDHSMPSDVRMQTVSQYGYTPESYYDVKSRRMDNHLICKSCFRKGFQKLVEDFQHTYMGIHEVDSNPHNNCVACGSTTEMVSYQYIKDHIDDKFTVYLSKEECITNFLFDGAELDPFTKEMVEFISNDDKKFTFKKDVRYNNNFRHYDFDKFTDYYTEIMTSHLDDKVICKDCFENNYKKLNDDFDNAYLSMNQVVTYPASYQKVLSLDASIKPKIQRYPLVGDKWGIVNQMKFWAAWNGYNVIYNITYDYQNKLVTGAFAKLNKPTE